jgi:hypothetical protein
VTPAGRQGYRFEPVGVTNSQEVKNTPRNSLFLLNIYLPKDWTDASDRCFEVGIINQVKRISGETLSGKGIVRCFVEVLVIYWSSGCQLNRELDVPLESIFINFLFPSLRTKAKSCIFAPLHTHTHTQ